MSVIVVKGGDLREVTSAYDSDPNPDANTDRNAFVKDGVAADWCRGPDVRGLEPRIGE